MLAELTTTKFKVLYHIGVCVILHYPRLYKNNNTCTADNQQDRRTNGSYEWPVYLEKMFDQGPIDLSLTRWVFSLLSGEPPQNLSARVRAHNHTSAGVTAWLYVPWIRRVIPGLHLWKLSYKRPTDREWFTTTKPVTNQIIDISLEVTLPTAGFWTFYMQTVAKDGREKTSIPLVIPPVCKIVFWEFPDWTQYHTAIV